MCGRFTQAYTWLEVRDFLKLTGLPQNLKPRYNVAPTTDIGVVVSGDGQRLLASMRWACPLWWQKTLAEVPPRSTREPRPSLPSRCSETPTSTVAGIIPASGFYEWTADQDGKQPHYFTPVHEPILAFAGLWEQWRPPDGQEAIHSCTIIVTAAGDWMSQFHDRAPACKSLILLTSFRVRLLEAD